MCQQDVMHPSGTVVADRTRADSTSPFLLNALVCAGLQQDCRQPRGRGL